VLLINHLGTIHASVQFALAEAASGEFLLRQLGAARQQEQVIAVLRTSTVKFRKPALANSLLRASARFEDTDAEKLSAELTARGRALVAIFVEVADASGGGGGGGVVTMTGQFDWFLQQHRDEAIALAAQAAVQ
jgi:hypothetical protein